jgi:PAS domain S-box-containing protein
MVGYTRDEYEQGMLRWTNITPPEYAEADRQSVQRLMTEGVQPPFEKEYFHKNGSRVPILVSAASFNTPGGDEGIAFILDQTEEKRIRQELSAAREKAEAANIAKTEFLANMSHEIRTPMNAVVGLANILANSRPLTQQQQEYVDTLQISAKSLLTLINDMLDLAKIEAASLELAEEPFSVTQIVVEVQKMMEVRAKEKGIGFAVRMDCACIEKRIFSGDPMRLRQIILNLCSNAVKFTDRGGIEICVACEPDHASDIETVILKVKDTGIGIPPDKLETVFEKFTQADSSINRKYGGTGLGLNITKTLVEAMKGSISVESTPGAGSVFTVTLPLKIMHSGVTDADGDSTREKETGGQEVILLVEDYPANILVATTFLKQFGYRCEIAKNGVEALEMALRQRFSLILMDIQMTEMNGLEATRQIRQLEKQKGLPRTPIIGMSAHALLGDKAIGMDAGMDDYIAKPFDPDELRDKIAYHTQREVAA